MLVDSFDLGESRGRVPYLRQLIEGLSRVYRGD